MGGPGSVSVTQAQGFTSLNKKKKCVHDLIWNTNRQKGDCNLTANAKKLKGSLPSVEGQGLIFIACKHLEKRRSMLDSGILQVK